MEAQNHYYGHSGAFARYVGLDRPRHIRGLVQHGWTAASPLETHFRDFPTIGTPSGRRDRALFVWSHASRAWDPTKAARSSVAIGAPWLYLCAAAEDRPTSSGTVIMPVHGIPTQPMLGDHAAVAREWARIEGPSTVCLYHVEAADQEVVGAYRAAGHTCVTLGVRTDAAFLSRLHRLLTGASRVVSNRLSTPVVYAAALGIDATVHGDAMRLDGEDPATVERIRRTWPEFHEAGVDRQERQELARAEVGGAYLREPAELRHLLGWDRAWRGGPWWDHWVSAPAGRAVTNLRRRGSAEASPAPAALSTREWLRGAISYLPTPLAAVVGPGDAEPIALG